MLSFLLNGMQTEKVTESIHEIFVPIGAGNVRNREFLWSWVVDYLRGRG